jgi:hypothetical protein
MHKGARVKQRKNCRCRFFSSPRIATQVPLNKKLYGRERLTSRKVAKAQEMSVQFFHRDTDKIISSFLRERDSQTRGCMTYDPDLS